MRHFVPSPSWCDSRLEHTIESDTQYGDVPCGFRCQDDGSHAYLTIGQVVHSISDSYMSDTEDAKGRAADVLRAIRAACDEGLVRLGQIHAPNSADLASTQADAEERDAKTFKSPLTA